MLDDLNELERYRDRSYCADLQYHCKMGKCRSFSGCDFSGPMDAGRLARRTDKPSESRIVAADSISVSVMNAACSRGGPFWRMH